ncbi:hypothetical protein ABID22_003804 [Pontibacter aydingkolensis]|uniref:Dolichyl-phosphate-mannose-protein mannosyltransferase n=1 Tax=Pontibacter aydingkolensis TaxID=1911536 RepID=A0ABS7CZ07_9BACT|nr:hypothetical protein [Pontibacter aydingkolensis]MBW7469094.1 hypothetical protein [Pontibacter aydingkolensis]
MTTLKQTFPFILFFIVLTFLVRNNGFFWDSIVLGSGYANWYYTTDFKHLFVPDELAGYPPLFGMYLALGWKLFGKTLLVSHVLILPFLIGIVLQAYILVSRFVKPRYTFWVLLLVLLEPTLLAQATQVAPDVILVFLYLLCLNSILGGKRAVLALALIFIAMISPRGTILVIALYTSDVLAGLIGKKERFTFKLLLSRIPAYIPSFIVTCIWLLLHYQHFGWIFYNKDSDWGQGSQLVSLGGFIKNLVVIGWRFADFGKAVMLILLAILLIVAYKYKKVQRDTVLLLALIFTPLVILSGVVVFYQNPIAHRYYIVVFMLMLLLLGHLLQFISSVKRLVAYSLTVISLLAGHYIVALYPDWLSKGWDGTLAHLPYFHLRDKMISYIKENDIAVSEVGSAYPNLRTFELTDLSNSSEKFEPKDLSTQDYIFYSNIFNDFTDEELEELNSNWVVIKEFKDEAVFIRLYKRNK